MAREIEEALAAWRDAVRRLETVLSGNKEPGDDKGAIDVEVAHLRERFHRLSANESSPRQASQSPRVA